MFTLPNGIYIDNLIENLKVFCWEASDILQNYSEKMKDINFKNEVLNTLDINDPVTLADLQVNEHIISCIKKKYPNANWDILSEENVKKSSNEFNFKSDWLWVLDPLDGTKDFIQGTGNYAMHLALNYKQKAYIGFVVIPEKDELWVTNGKKVWCERRNNSQLETNISKKKNLKEMILVTSKNHRNETLKRLINKLNCSEIIVMGSIGCKIAALLRGESDFYISLSIPGDSCPKDWDFAAPEAILKAAGGAMTNLDNQELSYGKLNYEKGGIILASNNRENHNNLCLQIKEIIRKYDLYPI